MVWDDAQSSDSNAGIDTETEQYLPMDTEKPGVHGITKQTYSWLFSRRTIAIALLLSATLFSYCIWCSTMEVMLEGRRGGT